MYFKLKIVDIRWLSKEAQEAILCVEDNLFQLFCFSQPFNGKVDDELNLAIQVLNPTDIIKIENQAYSAKKLSDTLNYEIKGKLIDKNKGLILLGNIVLEFDNSDLIPNDIVKDEFISFKCDRLDIY